MGLKKLNIHQQNEAINLNFEKFDKESLFDVTSLFYQNCCELLKKKPMNQRQWKRKLKIIKGKGLNRSCIDSLFVDASVLCCLEDSESQNVVKVINEMYQLTIKKLKK
tara:strand:+ start:1231 stop:1554 length:324 start_codon:yes stop_codon:yes gene_type:complete